MPEMFEGDGGTAMKHITKINLLITALQGHLYTGREANELIGHEYAAEREKTRNEMIRETVMQFVEVEETL